MPAGRAHFACFAILKYLLCNPEAGTDISVPVPELLLNRYKVWCCVFIHHPSGCLHTEINSLGRQMLDFPGGSVVKNPLANAGDTWVRSLVLEDPTCWGATKPVCHSYWACAPESGRCNYWAHVLNFWNPRTLEPVFCNKRSRWNEKPSHCNWRVALLHHKYKKARRATKNQHSQK